MDFGGSLILKNMLWKPVQNYIYKKNMASERKYDSSTSHAPHDPGNSKENTNDKGQFVTEEEDIPIHSENFYDQMNIINRGS